ncbi:MAG: GNAT family N-acetyltransferase [Mobilitalea sp.]
MLKAVIFDMDGVIIDSEPMHARAAILALKRYNVDITFDYLCAFIGSTTYYMCQKMIEDFNISVTPEELLKTNLEMKTYLLQSEGHTTIPYIIDLMKNLYEHGIKLSIASSSPSEAIEEVMQALQIGDYFEGYVSGMMVEHPKPSPDIFLEAAKRLGVSSDECLVIEDSFHGVSAAEAAGIACIGFTNPNSGNQDLRKATMLVEGFDEIDYEFINKVYKYAHMEPITILTTKHFVIRELTVSDIDALYPICIQPEIRAFLDDIDDSLEIEKEKHKAYIQNIYHFYGFGLWGVFLNETGRLIGRCGIELKILDNEDIYELGYLLDKDYQGHGYAKEFVSEVINYCFTELDIHRIIAVIDKNNIRSYHLAKQVGMSRKSECIRNRHACYKYEITYP